MLGIQDWATWYDINQGVALILLLTENDAIEKARREAKEEAEREIARRKNSGGNSKIILTDAL